MGLRRSTWKILDLEEKRKVRTHELVKRQMSRKFFTAYVV